MYDNHPFLRNPILLKYLSVILEAGTLGTIEDISSWVQKNADVLDDGNRSIVREYMSGNLQIADAFALLDASKSLVAKTLIHRKDFEYIGSPPNALVISVPTPEVVATYLNNKAADTAIVTFHIINNEVFIFVARNKQGAPIPGYGGITYNFIGQMGLKDELIESLDTYKRSLVNHKYEFQFVRDFFDFIGTQIFLLLWTPTPPEEVIFIPNKLFNLLPFHALSIKQGDKRIFLHDYVQSISYASCIQELAFASRQRDSHTINHASTLKHLIVQDDSANLPALQLEKDYDKLLTIQLAAGGMRPDFNLVTRPEYLPDNLSHYSWISWSAHARSSSSKWGDSHLSLGGNSIKASTIINNWSLDSKSIVVLSACESAVDASGGYSIDEYCGLDLAFRIAGARAVVASLWPLEDLTAALSSSLLRAWVTVFNLRPDTSVTALQRYFRTGRWKDFLISDEQMKPFPIMYREELQRIQEPLWILPDLVFSSDEFWAVLRCHGR